MRKYNIVTVACNYILLSQLSHRDIFDIPFHPLRHFLLIKLNFNLMHDSSQSFIMTSNKNPKRVFFFCSVSSTVSSLDL